MTFSQYRSKALKALWPEVRKRWLCDCSLIVNHPKFSTWKVDNICAKHWKWNNTITNCVTDLINYLKEFMA